MLRGEKREDIDEIVQKRAESTQSTENMIYCKFLCALSAGADIAEDLQEVADLSFAETNRNFKATE